MVLRKYYSLSFKNNKCNRLLSFSLTQELINAVKPCVVAVIRSHITEVRFPK